MMNTAVRSLIAAGTICVAVGVTTVGASSTEPTETSAVEVVAEETSASEPVDYEIQEPGPELVVFEAADVSVWIFSDVYAVLPYESGGALEPDPEVGRSVTEIVGWLVEHPELDTTEPQPVSLGGLDGFQVDVTVTAGSTSSSPNCPPADVCVDMIATPDGWWEGLSPELPAVRLILLATPDGGTVTVSLEGQVERAVRLLDYLDIEFTDDTAGPGRLASTNFQQAFTYTTQQTTVEGVDSGEWGMVWPGGDCRCSDGSEYAFFVRNADPTKVLFFLPGGGACYSADACLDFGTTPDINEVAGQSSGIFDVANPQNPFADYSVIYVTYCSGDLHVGDNTAANSQGRPVHLKGWVNGAAARDYLAEHFPDAAQIAVVGSSAGSIAAPVYGAAISDQLPDAEIIVLADSSGGYGDENDPESDLDELWGTEAMRSALPEYNGDWTVPRHFIAAGLHDPDIVMARFDYAFDSVQIGTGADPDMVAALDSNQALIEDAGVTLHSYTAPGADHEVFITPNFYDLVVNDVPLVDWVTALIAGEPTTDVHCDDCAAPG